MISIYEVRLLQLLPENLRHDPDVIAASKAIDHEFLLVVNEVENCILLPRIDDLDSEIVDLLAWETHVDFYETSLPIQVKRELVKDSMRYHRHKGTPAAVEELIETVFEEGKVVEWFEYGAEPYLFKVVTNNLSVTQEKAQEFIRALATVKNTRSWLDKVELTQVEVMNIYYAGILHTGESLTLRQVI